MAKVTGRRGRQHKAASLGAIEAELCHLTGKSLGQLRNAWTERFGSPLPPLRSREFVQRLLAWQIQAEALGGLNARTEQKLSKIADALDGGGSVEVPVKRDISSGVVLTREWRGAPLQAHAAYRGS